MSLTKKTEFAWAAGFIDGEGCFYRRASRNYIILTVSQKDIRPLLRLQEVLGGRINGPYHEVFQFRLDHKPLLGIIDQIWPYLSGPKKEQYNRKVSERNKLVALRGGTRYDGDDEVDESEEED